ncbi:conserved hypothetical protein [Leishmania major strain Friedlin]|uniref:Uncharacterized protein n=1 Tax=Leishmania major TaxID=5664 RepID=Q4QDH5_LEIMA|nr:conserved hypothetical protein [Leishmania major strain Friedlin]CAG9572733.1 Predicted_coiled-coil_domain-containing_protein_(DUF2360)_-_putative [Leishmania major strain Friedlin]CAJ07131.1 conserved hypothetical protein [Leishmania major strain Friedlin]|eukprot:XP_001682623.1 conserved hypothetical protein [Leishmania major strain Friedlin]
MATSALPPNSTAALVSANAAAVAEADADAQAVAVLVNRFVISTVQFLNRFSNECESRLVQTEESLQQLELQTQLLEHLLITSGAADPEADEAEDEGGDHSNDDDGGASYLADGDDQGMARDDGSEASAAYHYRQRRGRGRRSASENGDAESVFGLPAPPLNDRRSGGPPPPPGNYHKGPPRPPPGVARATAAAQEAEAARVATLAMVGAPVLMPPLSGDAPAPPPPLELRPGRLLMRNHPRLHGYFELLSLRVPAAFVKAKMQADCFQGEWLDTPDAPAPSGLSAAVRAFVDEPD